MTQPSVTVSVVSHEHFDEVPHLLRDLAIFAHQDVFEVIVTLNIPEPELSDWIEGGDWPFIVTLIRNIVPLGYGLNHNQAFRRCRTPFFCVVNPDVRLAGNPFPAMIAALKLPGVGCSYPLQSDGRGVPLDLAREVPTLRSLWRRYVVPQSRKKPQPRHWINGAFMLFSTSVFSEIGEFDKRYYMYCEDVDICLRLQLRGYRLAPAIEASVKHIAQHASRRRLQHLIWHVQSLLRLYRSKSYQEFGLKQKFRDKTS